MPKQSAGTLLYRDGPKGLEVLLVHPSGNYNRNKPWSIPKGEPKPAADLEETARRETLEEAGVTIAGPLTGFGHIDYTKSKKRVHCFAAPAPVDAAPKPSDWEVDRAEFVPLEKARELLHPEQRVFIDRLLDHLKKSANS